MKLYSPTDFPIQKQDLLQGFDTLRGEFEEIGEYEEEYFTRRRAVEDLRDIFAKDTTGEISHEALERASTLFKENLLRAAIFLAHSKQCIGDPSPNELEEIQQREKEVVAYAAAYGTLMWDKKPEEAFQVYPFGEERFQ